MSQDPIPVQVELRCEFCQGVFVPDLGGRHFCPKQGNRLVHIPLSTNPSSRARRRLSVSLQRPPHPDSMNLQDWEDWLGERLSEAQSKGETSITLTEGEVNHLLHCFMVYL